MTLRDTSRPSKLELALVAAATPRAQYITELVTGKQVRHALTIRDTLDDCDYVTGNGGGPESRRSPLAAYPIIVRWSGDSSGTEGSA